LYLIHFTNRESAKIVTFITIYHAKSKKIFSSDAVIYKTRLITAYNAVERSKFKHKAQRRRNIRKATERELKPLKRL